MVWNPYFSRRHIQPVVIPYSDINEPIRQTGAIARGITQATAAAVEEATEREMLEYRQARADAALALSDIENEVSLNIAGGIAAGDVGKVASSKEMYSKLRARALSGKSRIYVEAFDSIAPATVAVLQKKMRKGEQDAALIQADDTLSALLENYVAEIGIDGSILNDKIRTFSESVQSSVLLPGMQKKKIRAGTVDLLAAAIEQNPAGVSRALAGGAYKDVLTPEETHKLARKADETAFYRLMEGDAEKLKRVWAKEPELFPSFSARERHEYGRKIDAQIKSNRETVLAEDRVNRALAELEFWNNPTWEKVEAFDFRGNERQREKWLSVLESVPNPLAATRLDSVSEIAAALEDLTSMPADTPEAREKLFTAAAGRMADLRVLNLSGALNKEDMKKYNKVIAETATDLTIRRHMENIAPVLAKMRDINAFLKSVPDREERRKIRNRMNRAEMKDFLSTRWASRASNTKNEMRLVIQEVLSRAASGDTAGAMAAYNDGIIRVRERLYPETAGKKKGDIITRKGVVYTYAGDDGIHPIYEWGK